MSLTHLRGEQGLPFEDTLCLANGFTNDLWIGTSRGAIRSVGGRFDYRWIPAERVNAIAVHERSVYLATDAGLGILHYEPYTLAKKAAYYDRHLDEWGQRRLGFVHKLEWDAASKQFVREVSDNDGGYSGKRSYEAVRAEQNPWFNYLYGALTGQDADAIASVEHLRGWPLDLRAWSYQNSHRTDLRTPPGYTALKGGTRTFPPRETEPLRWDHWVMQPDGGAGGNDVVEPAAWLLAYWMGRHHGFIAAPTVTDPALLTVEHTHHHELGARPYDGPARPAVP